MKRLTLCIALSLLMLQGVSYGSDEHSISVWVNGKSVEFTDQQPVIVNDRTLLPINAVATKMGKSVEWDSNTSVVTVSDESTVLELIPGKEEMLNNEEKVVLDTAPVIINGRTCLPVRAVAEAFGAQVYWESSAREVHIITKEVFSGVDKKIIGDEFRLPEMEITDCGNCYCLNGKYLFSPVTVHSYNALRYAEAVNRIAEKLPEANVYSMLVPDSCEIYAPKRFYTGQWQAIELVYSNLSEAVTPIRVTEKLLEHGDEKIYFDTDHHWTHLGAYYAWQSYGEEKDFEPLELSSFERADTNSFSGSYAQRMAPEKRPESLTATETMERFLPVFDTDVTVYSDSEMTKKLGKTPLINTKNNAYTCFISGDHPLTVIKSSIGNGQKLAIIKESFGNALATWAVNNYEYVYVIDIRGFKGGMLKISEFYENTKFDDLIIESYPTTVESSDLRGYLSEMAQ